MRPLLLCLLVLSSFAAHAADKPNILWLTFEDSSPHLGCYGDKQANTPVMDALAKRGQRYLHAWSNAPVCAPARTTIISGRYAPSNGAEHMRSEVPMPAGQKMYPEFLRAAGYYCTNNSKEDYNLTKPADLWDESSGQAHWKNRPAGKPFFAIFNEQKSHESQIRAPGHKAIHDPAKVTVPAYMPDTPEVRKDWAQHFDNVTTVDGLFGKHLAELEAAGLAEDTIIFCYADHGTGMPRSKRCPMNSGLQVPFIVHFPAKWQHLAPKDYKVGGTSERLIAFVDLAPTVLSIAGVKPPDYLQGIAFAGEHQAAGRAFNFGFRGRMDERYDLIRSVSDGRFVYVRNFAPHLPLGQHVAYMFQQASTRAWHDLFVAGKLTDVQAAFWKPKASEELYDLQADPWETNNLAADPKHSDTRKRFAQALLDHVKSTHDLGFIPEGERLTQAAGKSPADVFAKTDVADLYAVAHQCTQRGFDQAEAFAMLFDKPEAAKRYWAATALLVRGAKAIDPIHAPSLALLRDASPNVRNAAAEALALHGSEADLAASLPVLLANANAEQTNSAVASEALNAIDHLGKKAEPLKDKLAALPARGPASDPSRLQEYPNRLLEQLSQSLGFPMAEKAAKKGKGKGKGGKAKAE